jgi:L-aminopeptidase/D-esterase-like protein
LEEREIGYRARRWLVPIVPAAILFDLGVGDASVRPDRAMGYAAASAASSARMREGNVGAGCGATVGKLAGVERAMKSGIGSAARSLPRGLVVGALVALNALGEIRDPRTQTVLAAPRADDGGFLDSLELLAAGAAIELPTSTTLAVVAANVECSKADATKIAQMAHDGLARTIYPVHTMHDGDIVFALATGGVRAPVALVGAMAAEVVAEAVVRGVTEAWSAGGLPAYRDRRR